MAHPKWHAIPTTILTIISICCYMPLAILSDNTLVLLLVMGFGVFMDFIDHLSVRRIKKILSGQKGPVEGWINWMHTWQALAGVIIIAIIVGNILPLLSYVFHILIDGGDIDHRIYSVSPLPKSIHRFYPKCLTYRTGLII